MGPWSSPSPRGDEAPVTPHPGPSDRVTLHTSSGSAEPQEIPPIYFLRQSNRHSPALLQKKRAESEGGSVTLRSTDQTGSCTRVQNREVGQEMTSECIPDSVQEDGSGLHFGGVSLADIRTQPQERKLQIEATRAIDRESHNSVLEKDPSNTLGSPRFVQNNRGVADKGIGKANGADGTTVPPRTPVIHNRRTSIEA